LSFIIINGSEEFLKERAALEEARSTLADFIYKYDYADLKQYEEESQIPPIFGGTRVFIVWKSETVPSLPQGSDTLIVVSAKRPLEDERAKQVIDFPKLKDYGDNNQVVQWILDEGNALNIDLSYVASALFVSSGRSLRKISSEIRKLAVLCSPGDVVTPEIAKSVMCFSAALNPGSIIDAICDGSTARALAYYDALQERTNETGWIIAYLQRHVLRYLKLHGLVEREMTHDNITKLLGVHPFVFKKVILPRAKFWTRASLVASINTLCDLDMAHKQGDNHARFGLELEIIRLSEEAGNVQRDGSG
jgi:DNA polymerase III delta subunit